jgi:uncharacterized protein YbjT (DUF2867 family)
VNRILITGASGNVGQQVVSQLLGTGVHVRALSRDPLSAAFPPGVEVVGGDLTQPETLDECLEGIDSVFLVWFASPDAVPAAIERIAKHARRVVFLSSPYQTAHPLFQGAQPNPISSLHAEIERRIKASGLDWTFLRPGMFASNARHWWAGQILAGDVVRWPYALAPTAPIHEGDIAAVAIRALCDSACSSADYLVTGPESLTQREQVSIIGEVLGRPLRFAEITPDEWRSELPSYVPAHVAPMLLKAWAAAIGQPALVTSTVAEITGVPARTFREWAKHNTTAFTEARAV